MPPTKKPPPARSQIFWQRLGSTLGLWGIVLLALFAPNRTVANLAFLSILSFLGIVGMREYARLFSRTETRVSLPPTITAGLALLLLSCLDEWQMPFASAFLSRLEYEIVLPAMLLLWLLVQNLRPAKRISLSSLAVSLLGWFYVFWLLSFIARIYYFPEIDGSWLLFYFLLVTKGSDLGAYATGSLCGRHKMAPNISPGKTWEGFAGALAVSTTASVLAVFAAELAPFRGLHCIVLGLLLGGFAVVGDLLESLLKRKTNVKDAGNLLPGIGGCLDLIDSLLFNAPLFYLYCRFTLTT